MKHWLDKKIEELKKTDNKVMDDEEKILKEKRIIANFEKNKNDIEAFINKLKNLFNKLNMVKEEGFEYYYEFKSMYDMSEYELSLFSGENRTQHPVYLRRLGISVSDEENKILISLFRGKRNANDKPWKFHDEQKIICDITKLDEDHAYQLIDWFAWKTYTPRGFR